MVCTFIFTLCKAGTRPYAVDRNDSNNGPHIFWYFENSTSASSRLSLRPRVVSPLRLISHPPFKLCRPSDPCNCQQRSFPSNKQWLIVGSLQRGNKRACIRQASISVLPLPPPSPTPGSKRISNAIACHETLLLIFSFAPCVFCSLPPVYPLYSVPYVGNLAVPRALT